jgi:hypothetical protein
MDLEQLRLRADPLRQFLAQHQHPISHSKALDLLAAIAGLRNWPEVKAFPERVAAANLDTLAAQRLAKRIVSLDGPHVDEGALLLALDVPAPPQLAVWPAGPRPGIYVTSGQAAALAVIERYLADTGGRMFFTEGVGWDNEYAVSLGESGIFSAGLAHAPTGTLVIAELQLAQEEWEQLKDRMTAAWNAASAGMRVVVVCTTANEADLYRDVSLLTHTRGEPADGEPNWLVGVVTDTGDLREQRPFVPPRRGAKPLTGLPAPDLELPELISQKLGDALDRRGRRGLIVAGMNRDTGNTQPLQVVAALLPRIAAFGPVARIISHHRGSYGKEEEVPQVLLGVPQYSSVESAVKDGCTVILLDSAYHGGVEEIQNYGEVLFVVPVVSLSVGRAVSMALYGPRLDDEGAIIDAMTAVICVGSVRGKDSKPLTWDMYVHVEQLAQKNAKRKKPLDLEEMFDRARAIRREDQISGWLRAGIVSEKSIRKDFPYLRIPKAAAVTSSAE